MTNTQSKLYSEGQMPATRNWGRSVYFLDISAEDAKKLAGDENNIGHIVTMNNKLELVPLFKPMFAAKESDAEANILSTTS
jgi:hypothetical protein